MMARVFGPIRAVRSTRSGPRSSSPTSTGIGRKPTSTRASTAATKAFVWIRTSSPGSRPDARAASRSASVPDATPRTCATPRYAAISRSKPLSSSPPSSCMRSRTRSQARVSSSLYARYSRASSMSRTRETTSAARASASYATDSLLRFQSEFHEAYRPSGVEASRVDFSRSISERRPVAAASVVHGRWGAVGLACLAGALLSIRLDEPGWFDNEGRFAEAAREMIVRHDWITPHVNLVPYLTKPPLTSWLAGLVFLVTGPSEWGRLVPIVSAVVTIMLTCGLGARLYGARTGLVAGLMLATMLGFVLEARTLRP